MTVKAHVPDSARDLALLLRRSPIAEPHIDADGSGVDLSAIYRRWQSLSSGEKPMLDVLAAAVRQRGQIRWDNALRVDDECWRAMMKALLGTRPI